MICSGEGSVGASFLGRPGGRFSSSESLTMVVFLEGRPRRVVGGSEALSDAS